MRRKVLLPLTTVDMPSTRKGTGTPSKAKAKTQTKTKTPGKKANGAKEEAKQTGKVEERVEGVERGRPAWLDTLLLTGGKNPKKAVERKRRRK